MRSQVFVPAVSVAGLLVIGHCVSMLLQHPVDPDWIALAILTLVTGALTIKIPGAAARLSVSETFVFASVLLFGSCAGTITVALEILIAVAVLGRKQRPNPHKLIFNVSSAALSIWLASNAFYFVAGIPPLSTHGAELDTILVPLAILSTSYFLLNSGLVAIALSIEKRERALTIWRANFSSLGINYFAGASLAALFVSYTRTIDLFALSVIIPLLLVSYLTFKTSLGRIEDATRHIDQMKRLYLSTVETLATAIDAKDQVTHGHIRRVQQFALALAAEIGVKDHTQLQALEAAALLHDTGKLAIPEHILNKPGKLTPGEFDKMKTHARVGAEILSSIDFPFPVVPIVRHHHENWDGTGYPDKLKGTDIPIGARILAVVDCFDALTSDRPYRGRMSTDEALRILFQRRGIMYDPLVVDTFAVCWPKLLELDVRASELETDPTAVAFEGRRALTTGESLGTRAVPDSIDRTLNKVLEKTGADLAILFATDREHDSIFSTVVVSGREGRTNDSIKMPLGYGVSGWVAVNSSTVTNADPVLDLRQLATKHSLVRIICVPVRQRSETVGVLSLYSSDPRGFSDADRSFIEEAVAALDCESGINVFEALTRDVVLSELPPLPTIH
jgi:putative nucleotidyltransferase with HDIG domain